VSILLEPGSLWAASERQNARALACGDLQPIASELFWLDDGGVRFAVRLLAGGDPKQVAGPTADAERDPFLPPYCDELFVADVSETHAALLNKWSVLGHHLLVVTRAFEAQQSALNEADFEALWACMVEFESLGFYNGGARAGASQPHKHLQLVPLPLGREGRPTSRAALPIEPLLTRGRAPFAYARAPLPGRSQDLGAPAGELLARVYRQLLAELSLDADSDLLAPYNLLLTRDSMVVVPRSRDAWEGIPINALGFAGALIVRDREALERLSRCGPLRALSQVGRTPEPGAGAS
jgi:ATP adenylyltransferase